MTEVASQTRASQDSAVASSRRKLMSSRRMRRLGIAAVILVPAFYFVPLLAGFYLACGVLDVRRQRGITDKLVEKYFLGNGFFTWMLSPLNLLSDLFAHRNRLVYRLEDLPPAHRDEIETCIREFVAHGDAIRAHFLARSGGQNRSMLTFKWYDAPQPTELSVPGFSRQFRYIKTIAVSVFNKRQRTSWHFGPLRLTFRVLYNLDPDPSRDVFIEANGKAHHWCDDPLYIFDDTIFHRSVNDVDHVRTCLFMDIVRPNRAEGVFNAAVHASSVVSGSFKRMFYKNWSFIR